MNASELFDELWDQYLTITPSAQRIHRLFTGRGERVKNDHIALRTFNDPRINIDVMARPFLAIGYEAEGEYVFQQKKLFARHFRDPRDEDAPKVFISELRLELCSSTLREIVASVLDSVVSSEDLASEALVLRGRLWSTPSFQVYEQLRAESEYAAWVYLYGFRANHFTVLVNALQTLESLQQVNELVKRHGFQLNAAGGEIKGSPQALLEQSSTLADRIEMAFVEGSHQVPSCYYEFAKRYPDAGGKLYQGFVAASADKIFESTDATPKR